MTPTKIRHPLGFWVNIGCTIFNVAMASTTGNAFEWVVAAFTLLLAWACL